MAMRYYIETFGCQMNDLDSEKMAGNLQHGGMEPADDPSNADLVILNTCAVREKAVQKVYARLGELKRLKARKPELLVGVVGCMAQLEAERIFKKAPYLGILAGPQKGHVLSELVTRNRTTQTAAVDLRRDDDPEPLETPYILRSSPWRASVTISEGCDRQCAYCVVPLTRGKERVRESAAIIKEIESLAAGGCIEILLLGQTVNSYRDRTAGNLTFAGLLERISKIDGLKRIRFMSPHPRDFSDELLEVMVSCPQVCNHIHLPVQSGSDRILRAMRRGYTRGHYLDTIRKIRNAPGDISISTDIIVGYPGESAEDFQSTLSLLDEVQYDSAFSFKYSPRPDTAALGLHDEVPEEEKSRRLEILQERQKRIQSGKNAEYLGRTVEVLVEDRARSRVRLAGRMRNNRIVNFDGPEDLIGRIVQAEITGFSPNSLKGIWIRPETDGEVHPVPDLAGCTASTN